MDIKRKLIIVDNKIPEETKEKLSEWGEVIGFSTEGFAIPAISGHPDIFFCKTPHALVVAPNLPEAWFQILDQYLVRYEIGNLRVGSDTQKKNIRHVGLIHYNAAVNGEYLVHTIQHTEPVILQHCHYLKKIPVKQGFTRSNLILLENNHYITSNKGIDEALIHHGLDGLFVSPEGIVLPGFQNGFIGGTMGLLGQKIFFTGSLNKYPEGQKVKYYLEAFHYEIIELTDGPLIDAGGILFM
jgi:hypothetical protein